MSEPRRNKKEPEAELEDLMEQRKSLRKRLANDADRKEYDELTFRIVTVKKQLNTI